MFPPKQTLDYDPGSFSPPTARGHAGPRLYVYVFMYIYIYIYIHTHLHIQKDLIIMNVYIYIYIYVYIYIYIRLCGDCTDDVFSSNAPTFLCPKVGRERGEARHAKFVW